MYTGIVSGDSQGLQATMPVDVVLLQKGLHLDFYEYDATAGIREERLIGSATGLNDTILNVRFKPQSDKGFLLAVVNVGTENVRIAGTPKELRYINETQGTPSIGRTSYNPVDVSSIVPGTFALIDLSEIPDLKNAVKVHFAKDNAIEIAWGLAAIYKNTALVWGGAIGLSALLAMFVLLKKRRG